MMISQRAIPVLFVATVCFFGMAFFSIFFNSRADDVAQSTTVGNATPVVTTVTTALKSGGTDQTEINLVESDVERVYVYGTATDNNSCLDIDQASNYAIALYRSDLSSSCSGDDNKCYHVANSALTISNCSAADDTTASYTGYVDLAYYADPTDAGSGQSNLTWLATVTVTDDSAGSSSASDSFDMNSLVAFTLSGDLAYGTLAHGDTSTAQTVTFMNTGNRDLDATQSASGDMVCDNAAGSQITVTAVHVDTQADFSYGQNDQALSTAAQRVNLNLLQRTADDTAATKKLYFRLRLPDDTGISGSCTNTLTFTARADS